MPVTDVTTDMDSLTLTITAEFAAPAVFTSVYESAQGLQKVLDMGVVEGATVAINQIDALVTSDERP